jgi:hypothetical protein
MTLSITTLSITTLSITTLSITKLSIMTFSITTLSIAALSIMTFSMIINKMRQSAKWQYIVILRVLYVECCKSSHYAEYHYAECHYAECPPRRIQIGLVTLYFDFHE